MAEQDGGHVFNAQEKLDILKKMKPYVCKLLIPSAIVSELTSFVDRDLRNHILEKEDAGCREEAAKLLVDKVIESDEYGLNIFLNTLHPDGANPGWPGFRRSLENIGETDTNVSISNHYSVVIHLLEGEIIKYLSPGILTAIIQKLYSQGAIYDYEKDLLELALERKGCHHGAVQMFSLLGIRDDQWPFKFFIALRDEHPDLLQKMTACGSDLIIDKESSDAASAAADSHLSERAIQQDTEVQTQVKELAHPSFPQGAEGRETLSDEENHMAVAATSSIASPVTCSEDGIAVNGSRVDDDDVCGARFSDDEKQDTEDLEKDQDGREQRREAPRELQLRKYQRELAKEALEGINTIICAPTGSGKTRVALHIVRNHLEQAHQGRPRKVVFLARTLPLVAQQYRNFREYLPQYNCELVTGESENSMTVHQQLEKNDIMVLTPKILENHLRPDKIPSLAAFTLIIFDECHHTRKGEPYNSVMKNYLQSKKEGEQGLPQIVGLTASIGVEKATTPDEARESILSIMGNLDARVISQVREHMDELLETVPRPEEDLMTLAPRENDDISNTIRNVMMKITEELDKCEQTVKNDSAVEDIRRLFKKRETDLKSQKFAQWAVELRNKARLLTYPKIPQNEQEVQMIMKRKAFSWDVQVLADWLVAYNEAFDVHDLTRPEDVLHYLERKSVLQRETGEQFISTELNQKVLQYYSDVEKQLQKFSKQQNPSLAMLGRTILQHISEAGDDPDGFRILVFVRTRATCQALCRWLNSKDADKLLKQLNAQPFTGTGAHQEQGGMTAYAQVETLKRFKQGDVKLLVCTSVGEEGIDIAECNLTIRYNHVGNEVTTVQTRGRSRKRGGRSILMAMPKIIEQEELNRKREKLMHDALDLIREMPQQRINDFVLKAQKKSLEVEEIDQIMKQVKKLKKEADFSIACPQCYKVKVNGAQIRSINDAHRVIIGHDIDNEVRIMPGKTFLKKDDWEMKGSVVCMCKHRLGQLLYYKKATFILVSPKYWVFLDKDNVPSAYKKWTSVPHQVQEVTPADIKEHLGIARTSDDESDDAP